MRGFAERGHACVGIVDAYGLKFDSTLGQTGLALGLRAGVGLALAVAALELLAASTAARCANFSWRAISWGGLWMTAVMVVLRMCCELLLCRRVSWRAWIYGL